MEKNKYNGYTNYETWNVALWIDNSSWNYALMLQCKSYNEFKDKVKTDKTEDGVKWDSPLVNVKEINELFNNR